MSTRTTNIVVAVRHLSAPLPVGILYSTHSAEVTLHPDKILLAQHGDLMIGVGAQNYRAEVYWGVGVVQVNHHTFPAVPPINPLLVGLDFDVLQRRHMFDVVDKSTFKFLVVDGIDCQVLDRRKLGTKILKPPLVQADGVQIVVDPNVPRFPDHNLGIVSHKV
jgi:hypothetical protein